MDYLVLRDLKGRWFELSAHGTLPVRTADPVLQPASVKIVVDPPDAHIAKDSPDTLKSQE